VANGLYLVFLLLGGFILPLDRLPGPIGLAAHALPAAALSDATRAALLDPAQPDLASALGLLAGWAVITMAAAALTFRAD
ncbi:MAG TPA: ABC transporter permease, partial [Chloroflexota bacterium]|nr:ABC transporter permease [Chloroflexota bacterium]